METALTNKLESLTDYVKDQLKTTIESQCAKLTQLALSDLAKRAQVLVDPPNIESKISSLEKCFSKIYNTKKP